jgi:hypothetical protein
MKNGRGGKPAVVDSTKRKLPKYEKPSPSPPKRNAQTVDKSIVNRCAPTANQLGGEIRLVFTMLNTKVVRSIPLRKFEQALDCSGSFLLHFSVDNKSEVGIEGRKLLMVLLEPLLGEDIEYHVFLHTLNSYLQTRQHQKRVSAHTENMRRFIDTATRGWKIRGVT